jgi:transposase-like protein
MDRTSLEQLLGQGLSLAEIGRRFDLHESTVGYWVEKYGCKLSIATSMRRGVGLADGIWRSSSTEGGPPDKSPRR